MKRGIGSIIAALGLSLCTTPRVLSTREPQHVRCDDLTGTQTELPAHFPLAHQPATNPSTAAGIALGRSLFFDPILSTTKQISCASCHSPEHAYSVPEPLPARGVTARRLKRHPPGLFNLAWADAGLFWDGGAKNLESASLAPIAHEDELGRSHELESLLRELAEDAEYATCFEAAFGQRSVTIGYVLQALAQFQRSLVSADARWDRAQRNTLELSASERAGARVFGLHCARCHPPPLFTDHGFHNNGLDAIVPMEPLAVERGRARVTQRRDDLGKFKTPGLRNVTRSAPYMHDGRFRSLTEVIDHYRFGMRASETLDAGFARPDFPGVTMSDVEARALEHFLRTLDPINSSP